jgi:hypothetical protein
VQLIHKEWEKGQRLAEPVAAHQERAKFLKEDVDAMEIKKNNEEEEEDDNEEVEEDDNGEDEEEDWEKRKILKLSNRFPSSQTTSLSTLKL